MIKFFRKIRQNLLTENKFSKYLLYAIGEIVLVVIGILIALSINNWNNNNVRSNQELNSLSNMLVDLKLDTIQFNNALSIHKSTLKTHQNLMDILLKKYPVNDSMGYYIRSLTSSSTPTFSSSTYKNISQTGLDIIKNDSLRKRIVYYYESLIPYLNNKSNIDPKFQFNTILKPYYVKHTKLKLKQNDSTKLSHTINDLERFLNDNEFLNELNLSINYRNRIIDHHNNGKKIAKNLIKELNTEISRRNN